MARLVVAADFGGTHLRAALVTEEGSVLGRREVSTPTAAVPPEKTIAGVIGLLSAVAQASPDPPIAACIATAGLVDSVGGKVIIAPNIPGFRNLQLAGPVSEKLGIVIDGRLYRGARGLAGEVGHIIVDPAGPKCMCGSRGCLEAIVSGAAFAERARKLTESGKAPLLQEIVGYREPTAEDLYTAATRGDRLAEAEIRHGGHVLGLGLGSLINVLNPEAITLSGGLLAMGEMLLDPMRKAMYSLAYGPAAGTIVRISELGDNAGILGAAAVAFDLVSGL